MGDQDGGLYQPEFPDHWERRPLYDLAHWVNGLAFRQINFNPTGRPVIKIAELKNGVTGQTKFTQQTFDDSVRVRRGDLLFSWSGQPETSIDAFWWRGPEGWLNQHLFRITPAGGVDRTFFYYLLRYLNPNFVGIARNKQTTGLGHVTRRDLEAIEAALPPFSEQRAIAEVLGALDDKIDANQRIVETVERVAIYISWSKMATTTVGEVAGVHRDFVSASVFANQEVEHFSLPAFDSSRSPRVENGTAIKSGKFLLNGPTVLVSKLNPHIPRVWMAVPTGARSAVTSTEFVGLVPSYDYPVEVLWSLCASAQFSSQLAEMVRGTTGSHQRVSVDDVLTLKVPDPEEIGEDVREVVAAAVGLAGTLRQESLRLATLRDALLPRLLSGDLQVRNFESLEAQAV